MASQNYQGFDAWMESFCGSPFWDSNLTWNTDAPDLTPCFEKTILVWIPCGFLWLLAAFEIAAAINFKRNSLPLLLFDTFRFCVGAALASSYLAEFGYGVYYRSCYPNIHLADLVAAAVKGSTFVLVLFLQRLNKKNGVHSSGVLFFFWFFIAICSAFEFQSTFRVFLNYSSEHNDYTKFSSTITLATFPLVVFMFCLEFLSDEGEKKIPEPEINSPFPSKLTFQWFWPIVWRGYRKPLEITDLFDINPEDKSESLTKKFHNYWRRKRNLSSDQQISISLIDKVREHGRCTNNSNTKGSGQYQKSVSILPAMWSSNWDILLFSTLLKVLHDVLQFVSPQLLDLLIQHVKSKEMAWKGYLYAGLIFVAVMLQTFLLGQYFQRMFRVGMRIRTALVGAVYQKSLVISNAARRETTAGEIVNLMSVDSQRFMELMTYLNMIWSGPLQIGLSLYFLWKSLGPSVLAGVTLLVLLIPLNITLVRFSKRYQLKQMQLKDERVKLINEMLSGIKVLKVYAWEPSFEEQINDIRNKEVNVLRKSRCLQVLGVFVYSLAPFMVSLVTFGTYVMLDARNTLDSRKAFVSLALFNLMRMPMNSLPNVIVSFVESSVSLKRLNKFLNAEEINTGAVSHHDLLDGSAITIQRGVFTWDKEPNLNDVDIKVSTGNLVAVVGAVGSGKSSLLSAILGEMEIKEGSVNSRGTIAYVAQQAWIQNATLRDNILFGRPYDPVRYKEVIEACALAPDLHILPAGDKTEIGEKGINLSGGQKQRVSLARAVYHNSDIYLLDDPLSAVDSHVGKQLFDQVIGPSGLLKDKTRLFVTHGITHLPQMDHIFVMTGGRISEAGTFQELLDKRGDFSEFVAHHINTDGLDRDTDSEMLNSEEDEAIYAVPDEILPHSTRISESSQWSRKMSINSQNSIRSPGELDLRQRKLMTEKLKKQEEDRKDKLIEAEKMATGRVTLDVYRHYIKSMNVVLATCALIFFSIYSGFALGSSLWLSEWSEQSPVNGTQDVSLRNKYLGVYGALGLGQALAMFIANVTITLGCVKAAAALHRLMLSHILRSPMSFFDTTPLGRIVNRFSKDIDVVDTTFPANILTTFLCLFQVLNTFIIISISTPWFLVVMAPLVLIYLFIQTFYVKTSRQLRRLESVTRSPIYSHFSETLSGATTIRAYGAQAQFISESERKVDTNLQAYYPSIIANRWLAIRLETIGNSIIFFAALLAILADAKEGSVGLSISYALNITQTLAWLVRMTSDIETNIVAVERIKEYGETVQEAPWSIEEKKPLPTWPSEGKVTFTNYQTRYREGLDLVLRGVNCTISPGEKVGIVGRTGAGKTSMTLALFRIVEAAGGSIEIDDLDIAKMGLHDVRGNLTIIPQDPILFSGTLRFNLDPFKKNSDSQLWNALDYAHLKQFVSSLPDGLEHPIQEGGENLSVGQRQLVCLARALLRKTKVLILDEATAAVDLETDDLIQNTIRCEFRECTVLTIAHRLNTIMDSSRVIVLDKGEVIEFDTPLHLLQNHSSVFHGMAKDAGLV